MADSFPMAGKYFFMHCTGYFTIYLLSSNILVIKILCYQKLLILSLLTGELRTFMGTNLISTLSWKYTLATSSGNSGSFMGIRKTLRVNNEDLLTVFYDKLQRRQVLYGN